MCTTEHGRYYSRKLNWCKENGLLPNTSNIVRHSTFLRLDFSSLKVEDTGVYKCNIDDNEQLQEKHFQLTVFGKPFGVFFIKLDKFCVLDYITNNCLTNKSIYLLLHKYHFQQLLHCTNAIKRNAEFL